MRKLAVLALAGLVVCSAASAQEHQPTLEAQVRDELRELRKKVEELSKRVEALEAKLAASEQALWPAAWDVGERRADLNALRAIKLPANPTKEQAREYVDRILTVSERQSIFSTEDPQPYMIMAVGPENLDVLLDVADVRRMGETCVVQAIIGLAREEDKRLILDVLAYRQELAEVVLKKGWEQDAKDILIAELHTRPQHLPTEWIQAVARLRDPSTYEDLKEYLVYGSNRGFTYEAIMRLPGIELADAVARAWEEAKNEGRWECGSMAGVAVAFGHVDALEMLLGSLDFGPHSPAYIYEARGLVLRHTEARGTNEELRRWFEENKDKLVFDPATKKFRVQERK